MVGSKIIQCLVGILMLVAVFVYIFVVPWVKAFGFKAIILISGISFVASWVIIAFWLIIKSVL